MTEETIKEYLSSIGIADIIEYEDFEHDKRTLDSPFGGWLVFMHGNMRMTVNMYRCKGHF